MLEDLNRFLKHVKKETSCWFWCGALDTSGYGLYSQKGKLFKAHRLSYQKYVGEIPTTFEIDHLCRNRNCVNPLHLEAVTHKINILRGEGACAKNARKTHCKRGHPLTNDNVIKPEKSNSQSAKSRICKACIRQRQKA